MKTILIFILFLSFAMQVLSQSLSSAGQKNVIFYSSDDLKGGAQSWSITQSESGLIYVGNSSGIMEFDGITWNTVSNDGTVRCFAKSKNGVIYSGGDNNLGFLYPDKNHHMLYQSLLDSIPKDQRDFFVILSIFEKDGLTYFIGFKAIYIFKNNSLQKVIRPESDFRYSFLIKNHIIVRQSGLGLYELQKETLRPCGGGSFFADKSVYAMLQLDNGKILVGTGEKGLFVSDFDKILNGAFNDNNFQPFSSDANEYLTKFRLYHGTFTKNKNIAFSTSAGGLLIVGQDGSIKSVFNKSNGLKYIGVNFSYTDKEDNIWLSLQNGIAKIENGSPICFFPGDVDFSGLLFTMFKDNNTIWVGSTDGLFKLTSRNTLSENDQSLYSVARSQDKYFSFMKIDTVGKDIFASTRRGLFTIRDNELLSVSNKEYGFVFHHYKKNPNLLFVSNLYGLFVFKKENNQWKAFGQVQGISHEIRAFHETAEGDLWLNSVQNKIPRLSFSKDNYLEPKIKLYDIPYKDLQGISSMGPEQRLPFLTVNLNGQMFSYNPVKDSFEPDSRFPLLLNNDTITYSFSSIFSDSIVYAISSKGLIKINLLKKNNPITIVYPKYLEPSFFMYPDVKENVIWISSSKGLFCFNLSENQNIEKSFNSCIRSITIGNDSLIFSGLIENETRSFTIPFENNSLSVNFAALWFERLNDNEYSYILEGFNSDWSKWSNETKVNFSFIPAGKYVFKVKARNHFGTESNITSFSIIVASPWYATWWAYVIYFFSAIIIIIIIIQINNARLKRANIKLENTITLRTAEIEKQKNEIELKNLQLQIINKELEKLSIVARETDNAIMIMDSSGKFEWLNDGFTRLNGFDLPSLILERSDNILDYSKLSNIKEVFSDCVNNKKTIIYEADSLKKDGSVFWAQTTLTPIVNSSGEVEKVVAIDSDISKLKQAQKEITKQKDEIEAINSELEKLSIVAQETDNVVMIMDKDGNYEWINDSLKKMYGYGPEEFYKLKGKNILGTSFSEEIQKIWSTCINEKKSVDYQAIVSHMKGFQFWTQTTLTPILDEKGNVVKVIGIDIDITRIKKAEEKIKMQSDELSKSLAELQKNSLLISQSIDYAEKIQKAILPSEKHFREIFPESFVLLLPRDIVSGDFYWCYKTGTKQIVIAADCTGHGVPGAFMSLIGNSLLNEIVKERKTEDPALILEQMNEKVIEILRQNSGGDSIQEDGMDMAIVVYDSVLRQITFAGASMPLILYNEDGVVKVSGDLFSVGGSFSIRGTVRYKNHIFNTDKFDGFFLYSDGFQDQFGGKQSKKFMADKFVKLLNTMTKIKPEEQKASLIKSFNEWKGSNRQIDDVLVLGSLFRNSQPNEK